MLLIMDSPAEIVRLGISRGLLNFKYLYTPRFVWPIAWNSIIVTPWVLKCIGLQY